MTMTTNKGVREVIFFYVKHEANIFIPLGGTASACHNRPGNVKLSNAFRAPLVYNSRMGMPQIYMYERGSYTWVFFAASLAPVRSSSTFTQNSGLLLSSSLVNMIS